MSYINMNVPQPSSAPSHRIRGKTAMARFARNHRGITSIPASSSSTHATPNHLSVTVHDICRDAISFTITGFGQHELDFRAHHDAAFDHLLTAIGNGIERFRNPVAKVWISWDVFDNDGHEFSYHMNMRPITMMHNATGETVQSHVEKFLNAIVENAHELMEVAKLRKSGIVFVGMRRVDITVVTGKRGRLLPPPKPVAVAENTHGSRYRDLPEALKNGTSCLNINNNDNKCFRYAMTAWKLNYDTMDNARRASLYWSNSHGRGRIPRYFTPEFKECGLNFDMLIYPVRLDALADFERVNDVGIYVYEWHGEAVPVRRPPIARNPKKEVVLLLWHEHWVWVKNVHVFLSGVQQYKQHFCYRCQKIFWKSPGKLAKHLEVESPLSCLEMRDDEKIYRLPKPEYAYQKFRKFQYQLPHPLRLYCDFETYQNDVTEESSRIVSKMNGVASYGYMLVSDIPQIPSRVRIARGSGVDFLNEVLAIANEYRSLADNPVNITMTADDYGDFATSNRCYLCNRQRKPLLRDHDHFTGRYRGAICNSCNRKACVPKQIVAFFHNLEGFDGHYIMRAIAKLNKVSTSDTSSDTDSDTSSDTSSDTDSDTSSDTSSNASSNAGHNTSSSNGNILKVLANTSEKYIQISYGPIVFRDSRKFNPTSVGKWIDSQRQTAATLREAFPILSRYHPWARSQEESHLNLLLRKVPMSYKSITSDSYFNLPPVLERSAYNNDLGVGVECDENDYMLVQDVVKTFELRNQGDYHDLYLHTDVLALADVMEAMRERWMNYFGVDMIHYVTLPSAAYDSMLKKTKVSLELIHKNNGGKEFMDKIDRNIRGGLSCIFQPYAKANNWQVLPIDLPSELSKFTSLHTLIRDHNFLRGLKPGRHEDILPAKYFDWMVENGYDSRLPTSWISYTDANSLYPHVMSKALPLNGFHEMLLADTTEERLNHLSDLLKKYIPDSTWGYFIEVTYHVPAELHDKFDFAPIAKRSINTTELSEYQQKICEQFGRKGDHVKLFPFLGEQRKILHHVELLQFWCQMGVRVTEVHSIHVFKQTKWMAPYVSQVYKQRCQSKDKIEKTCLKLALNSPYGKTCQDARKQRNVELFTNSVDWAKACSKSADYSIMFNDDDGFLGIVNPERLKGATIRTPRAVAFSTLELSRLPVLKAHYSHFNPRGHRLLMTDTDSLIHLMFCDDMLAELASCVLVDFDLHSAFPSEEALANTLKALCSDPTHFDTFLNNTATVVKQNKGKLGAFKLESETAYITEFVGLAAKMYSVLVRHANGDLNTFLPDGDQMKSGMKCKGVHEAVLRALTKHQSYKEMLLSPIDNVYATFREFRSFRHEICTVQTTKRMLTALHDKTFQVSPFESRPLGHWRNEPSAMVDA